MQASTIQSKAVFPVREDRRVPSKPLPMLVTIDREILSYLGLSKGKSRVLISTKTAITLNSVRWGIENKFKVLEDQPYKLRYRVAKDSNADLLALKENNDVFNATKAAMDADSSLQVFVQVNPGVFPPTVGAEVTAQNEARTKFPSAASFVHRASVDAMRSALIDPVDCDSYTMVSFYGFRQISDPEAFAFQLESLWKPYHALGRVSSHNSYLNAFSIVNLNALAFHNRSTLRRKE